ncbi:membrane-spanning 4-domains subfamily A member 7 [Sorex fumeus]|uniref:membrane-spanning 4-domains subfamily A member 7 n=1 Tax=Sorex fumeus TaxID=62283 RepID=UPI0024AC8325|nr:membrane-spanning 4-domains subfamily A member 7 [Sorex fumeus]
MLTEPKTKTTTDTFTPKTIMSGPEEKYSFTKEDNLKDVVQKELTVLGTIQILCCLMISSLGAIMVSAPYSPYFNTAVSIILMPGYPFAGALCFGITGILSIISGKNSTKIFVLILNLFSTVVAGTGLILLAATLKALKTASEQCDSGKDSLALPNISNIQYHYPAHKAKDCLLTGSSLTTVLVVMFLFTVLELLLAAYASVVWWKQNCSKNLESEFSLPQSQDLIQHVKKNSSSP